MGYFEQTSPLGTVDATVARIAAGERETDRKNRILARLFGLHSLFQFFSLTLKNWDSESKCMENPQKCHPRLEHKEERLEHSCGRLKVLGYDFGEWVSFGTGRSPRAQGRLHDFALRPGQFASLRLHLTGLSCNVHSQR